MARSILECASLLALWSAATRRRFETADMSPHTKCCIPYSNVAASRQSAAKFEQWKNAAFCRKPLRQSGQVRALQMPP
jgi:hypothetical protein